MEENDDGVIIILLQMLRGWEKNERGKWEANTMSFYPENTRNRYKGGNKFRTPPSRGLSKQYELKEIKRHVKKREEGGRVWLLFVIIIHISR